MSELRFTCPACGQHMQCEKAYCGDKTICPNCQSELRVPFSHTPVEPKTKLPRAELVSAPAEPLPTFSSDQSALTQAAVPISSAPLRTAAEKREEGDICICPVCKAELKVPPPRSTAGTKPPLAELVQREAKPSIQSQPNAGTSAVSPIDVREEQIANAREAHPVSLYPSIKPRLAYIVSGGESVAPKPSEFPTPDAHKDAKEPPSSESLAE